MTIHKHAVALAVAGLISAGSFAGCGGNASMSVPPPVTPVVLTLSPESVVAGQPTLTLIVNGTGFGPSSTVEIGGNVMQTTFVNPAQLTAVVPASFMFAEGFLQVTVVNPPNLRSNIAIFPVSSIFINALSPNSAKAGGAAFTLTVGGALFNSSSVVEFNGSALPTTFVNANTVTAAVPASAIASAGTVQVVVANTAFNKTGPFPFTITP